MTAFRILAAGDAALVVELPARIDADTSARIIAMADAVRQRFGALIRDAVVGYHTVTVYFDPVALDGRWLEGELADLAAAPALIADTGGATIEVPVCYGGDFGPDLAEVAAFAGISEADVIGLHAGRDYRVFVVGFVPGSPTWDRSIHGSRSRVGRRRGRASRPARSPSPRARPGIYPMETPGGWHLIGRTPVAPFDPDRVEPVLFRPGDRVRFRAIPREEFDEATR